MNEKDLAPILASPDDDAPRLALAKKLRGARGRFIELQCKAPSSPEAEKLLRKNYEAWAGPRVASSIEAMSARFERGFLHAITFDHGWRDKSQLSGPKLLKCLGEPSLSLVRRVTFMNGAGGPDASRRLDESAKILTGIEAEGAKLTAVRLLRDPVMRQVREVRGLEPECVLALAQGKPVALEVLAPHWPMRSEFPSGALRAEEVTELGEAKGLPQLRSLTVRCDEQASVEELSRSPLVSRLEELTFARFPAKGLLRRALGLPVQRLSFVARQYFDFNQEVERELSLRLERAAAGWRGVLCAPARLGPREADLLEALERELAGLKKSVAVSRS